MKPFKVLLADDEKDIRLTLGIIIERMGFEVLMSVNGLEALKVLEKHGDEIDLLVSDLHMPFYSGEELVRKMRKRGMETPVVIISGDTDREVVLRMLKKGCVNYIRKPFSISRFEDKLAEVVGHIGDGSIDVLRETLIEQVEKEIVCNQDKHNSTVKGGLV